MLPAPQPLLLLVPQLVQNGDVLPIFPLPDFILFPLVHAPLHIFEPRYRQMMDVILDAKGTFCMAVLDEAWEEDYAGSPPIRPVGCACVLRDYERLADGRYNIAIKGIARVRLSESDSSQYLFRQARIELLEQDVTGISDDDEARLRRLACAVFNQQDTELMAHLRTVGVELLMNLMAFHAPIDHDRKLALFETEDSTAFCAQLIAAYEELGSPDSS